MQTIEYTELMKSRESHYRFLAELYKTEISEKMLEGFTKLDFESLSTTAMGDGYALVKKYLDNKPVDPVTDLAVDFARVFLGAGIVQKELISAPYESVYTSPERLIMQDARDQVLHIYRENGVAKAQGFDVPEDHLAIELEFMAHLCVKTAEAYEEDHFSVAEQLIEVQKNFIDEHLLNWVPKFGEEVSRFARTDFYRGIISITLAFLQMDKDVLNDIN